MYSVTQRIANVKQPRGGYLKPSAMYVTVLSDDNVLNENENLHPSIIGMTVDYLTRYMMGTEIPDAFEISIRGAALCNHIKKVDNKDEVLSYLTGITGIDDKSIINACKMTTFDAWYRNPFAAVKAKTAEETCPDKDTIENIRILVQRGIAFWDKYGPIKVDGFTFEKEGYSFVVSSGDGDFLTEDTLWDFKVSVQEPQSKHTLQLLMYYIMGKHSKKPEFEHIDKIGIFNPRKNKVYLYNMKNMSPEIIKTIEDDVICYR